MTSARPLAGQPWLKAPASRKVLQALEADGRPARFVGGCVRDGLLGRARPQADLDLATPARPEEVMRLLAAAGLEAIPTGLAHGTVTAVVGDRRFEITTLRQDVLTDGRHALVAFTDDFEADAARRDFTINAMSCDRGRPALRLFRRPGRPRSRPRPLRRHPTTTDRRGFSPDSPVFSILRPLRASARRIRKRSRPAGRRRPSSPASRANASRPRCCASWRRRTRCRRSTSWPRPGCSKRSSRGRSRRTVWRVSWRWRPRPTRCCAWPRCSARRPPIRRWSGPWPSAGVFRTAPRPGSKPWSRPPCRRSRRPRRSSDGRSIASAPSSTPI